MSEHIPSRRDAIFGLGATGAASVVGSGEAAAADRRIQQLEGFRSDAVVEAVLSVQDRALEKLVLAYIAAFESSRVQSQEAMNAHAALQAIQKQIDAKLEEPAFKMALLLRLQKVLTGKQKKIVDESIANKDTAYSVSATFYYSAAGRLGFGIDVNGLWATGG